MSLEESYRALGLKPDATLIEARRAYYRLIKFFHPDRHQASPGLLRKATEETKKLNLAYERIRKAVGGRQSSRPTSTPPRTRPKSRSVPPTEGQPYIISSCEIKLTWIPAGRFTMGSPDNEAGRSPDEGPQTRVTIVQGFWLGTYAVTQEQWKIIAESVPTLKPNPSFFRGTNFPVEQVSWNDCQLWLKELNEIEQTATHGNYQFTLPTEAQWEYACRADSNTRFHFGNADAQLIDHAWFVSNSAGQPHTVGQKLPNQFGLHDMHGNVWEWCQDRYGPLRGGEVADPTGPPFGLKRVHRGGSWGVNASQCRAAYRVYNQPEYRDYTLGFRVALSPSG